MLFSYFVFLFILPAAIAAPFTRPETAPASQDHWWSHLVESVGRALGMRGYKHGGSFAIDIGMPQTGDNWFWNLNGWTLAESELSVVVSGYVINTILWVMMLSWANSFGNNRTKNRFRHSRHALRSSALTSSTLRAYSATSYHLTRLLRTAMQLTKLLLMREVSFDTL